MPQKTQRFVLTKSKEIALALAPHVDALQKKTFRKKSSILTSIVRAAFEQLYHEDDNESAPDTRAATWAYTIFIWRRNHVGELELEAELGTDVKRTLASVLDVAYLKIKEYYGPLMPDDVVRSSFTRKLNSLRTSTSRNKGWCVARVKHLEGMIQVDIQRVATATGSGTSISTVTASPEDGLRNLREKLQKDS